MTNDSTGDQGDRVIIDDPWSSRAPIAIADLRRFIDQMTLTARSTTFSPQSTPLAMVVAEGSPRLPEIRAALDLAGLGDRVVVLAQSGGQVIDALEPTHVRIAKAFTIPPDMLLDSPARPSMAMATAEVERRSRLLAARIDAALLTGVGFPTAENAVREWNGPARSRYDQLLARAYIVQETARQSKRRSRRLRGRTRAARRKGLAFSDTRA